MRKKDDKLRSTILELARETANTQGPDAINIRALAKQAGVASGTVYNYFKNKGDILLALTEEYWQQALADMQQHIRADSFTGQLEEMYAFLSGSISNSAGMLMGSLASVEEAAKQRMQQMQSMLREQVIVMLSSDDRIRAGVWNEVFNEGSLADFIMALEGKRY